MGREASFGQRRCGGGQAAHRHWYGSPFADAAGHIIIGIAHEATAEDFLLFDTMSVTTIHHYYSSGQSLDYYLD